jgi:hypothetical protein
MENRMSQVKPRENVMMRMDQTEVAIADAVTEKMGARNRSAAIRELISEKARKFKIKRTSPEVLARLAAGTEGATDGE